MTFIVLHRLYESQTNVCVCSEYSEKIHTSVISNSPSLSCFLIFLRALFLFLSTFNGSNPTWKYETMTSCPSSPGPGVMWPALTQYTYSLHQFSCKELDVGEEDRWRHPEDLHSLWFIYLRDEMTWCSWVNWTPRIKDLCLTSMDSSKKINHSIGMISTHTLIIFAVLIDVCPSNVSQHWTTGAEDIICITI